MDLAINASQMLRGLPVLAPGFAVGADALHRSGFREDVAAYLSTYDQLASYVAETVRSHGVEELEEAVDLLLEDERYRELVRKVELQQPFWLVTRMVMEPEPLLADSLLGTIPESLGGAVATAIHLERVTVRGLLKLFEKLRPRWPQSPSDGDGSGFANDPDLPVEVKRALLGREIATISSVAAIRVLQDAPEETGLIALLVGKWVEGSRRFTALLEAMEFVDVSEQALPHGYRLDLAGILKRAAQAKRGQATALAIVTKTGNAYPLAENAHDE